MCNSVIPSTNCKWCAEAILIATKQWLPCNKCITFEPTLPLHHRQTLESRESSSRTLPPPQPPSTCPIFLLVSLDVLQSESSMEWDSVSCLFFTTVCSCGRPAVCEYDSSSYLYSSLRGIERYKGTNGLVWVWVLDPESWPLDNVSWILNLDPRILGFLPGITYQESWSRLVNVESWMKNTGWWILNDKCWMLNVWFSDVECCWLTLHL